MEGAVVKPLQLLFITLLLCVHAREGGGSSCRGMGGLLLQLPLLLLVMDVVLLLLRR